MKKPSVRLGEESLERAAERRLVSITLKELTVTLPAVPSMIPQWLKMVIDAVSGAGAILSKAEIDVLRRKLATQMDEAFRFSQYSTVAVECRVHGVACRFQVDWSPMSVVTTYDRWPETKHGITFGEHPDAMVMEVAATLGPPAESPVLDLGAGVGRNALALGKLGHPVVAIEPAQSFATMLFEKSVKERITLRIIQKSILDPLLELPREYFSMVILSEVLPEIRDPLDVRRILEGVVASMRSGGLLVFNAFVCPSALGSNEMIRQAASASASSFLTEEEITDITAKLDLDAVSRVQALDFERTHLPPEAWPPTSWFEEWSLGRNIFTLPKDVRPPIELQWFVWKKR